MAMSAGILGNFHIFQKLRRESEMETWGDHCAQGQSGGRDHEDTCQEQEHVLSLLCEPPVMHRMRKLSSPVRHSVIVDQEDDDDAWHKDHMSVLVLGREQRES